jgi:hypothetical protein
MDCADALLIESKGGRAGVDARMALRSSPMASGRVHPLLRPVAGGTSKPYEVAQPATAGHPAPFAHAELATFGS